MYASVNPAGWPPAPRPQQGLVVRPKPGPTGVVVAIASALVPLVALAVFIAAAELLEREDASHLVQYAVPMGLADLVPLVYLVIVGRGVLGKALGGSALAAVAVIDQLFGLVSQGASEHLVELTTYAITLLGTVLTVVGWGLARRSGWWWLTALPLAVIFWAVLEFGSFDWFSSQDEDSFLGEYGWPIVFVFLLNVVPIAIGWGIDLLSRPRPSAPVGAQYPYARQF